MIVEKNITIGSVVKLSDGMFNIANLNIISIGTFLLVAFLNCSIKSEKSTNKVIKIKIITKVYIKFFNK